MIIFRFYKPAIWVVIITILCLMPADEMPRITAFTIPHFDKLVHAGMYFILVIFLVKPLQSVKIPVVFPSLIFSIIVGSSIEVLQFYITSTRSADFYDIFADFAGAIIGLIFYMYSIKGNKWERLF
jgi:VanZ family protein